MTHRLAVNRHHITLNRMDGGDRPVFLLDNQPAGNHVEIHGPSRLVWDGKDAWVETDAKVEAK